MSFWTWLKINFKIGALSFGGSGRAMLFLNELVERRRALSDTEFREALTLSQVLPGPNLINLSAFIGMKLQGWLGAIFGVILLALPGAILGVAAIYFLMSENLNIKVLFQGFSLGSVILFFLFILRLLPGLKDSVDGKMIQRKAKKRYLLMATIAFFSLAGAPLIPVLMVGLGVAFIDEFSENFWDRRSRKKIRREIK